VEHVLITEIETEAVLGNIVASVAATLTPSAMISLPMGGPILLPGGVFLPTASLGPTTLLLPGLGLLLISLRLLLLGALLLLSLLILV
jgi:hypothetical protein